MTIKRQRWSRLGFLGYGTFGERYYRELAAKPEVADQVDSAVERLHCDADRQL